MAENPEGKGSVLRDDPEAIRTNWESLVKMKHVNHIVEQLDEEGHFRDTERDIIDVQKSEHDRNQELLKIVWKRRESNIHRAFVRTLFLSGQKELGLKIWAGELRWETCPTLEYRVWCEDMARIQTVQLPTRITSIPYHLKEKLKDGQEKLMKNMRHVKLIIDQLLDVGCLKEEVFNELQNMRREDQTRRLLGEVCDLSTYLMLVECLDVTDRQTDLNSVLREDEMPRLDKTLTDRLRWDICREEFREDQKDGTYQGHRYATLNVIPESPNKRGASQGEFVFDRQHSENFAFDEIFVTSDVESSGKKQGDGKRRRMQEFIFDSELGENVSPEKIFLKSSKHLAGDEAGNRHSVLVVGAPGAGKSHGCSYLQARILDGTCKVPGVDRPLPILIRLRSVKDRDTTLRDLLLTHLPQANDDDTRRAVMRFEKDIVIILDGADECPVNFVNIDDHSDHHFDKTDHKAPVGDILGNLLTGHLMKTCHLLVTSRPFNLERCWKYFSRKVEITGFKEDTLKQFLQEELGQGFDQVWSFLETNRTVMSLCFLPLHAVSLVRHVKYTPGDILLKSRTDFTVALITSYMRKTNTKLKGGNVNKDEVWEENSEILRKLSELAMKSLQKDKILPHYSSRELNRAGINDHEIRACGLFTGNFTSYENEQGSGVKQMHEVSHLSVMEFIMALGLVNSDLSTIQHVADTNEGHYDLILMYAAALAGNEAHWKLVNIVFDTDEDFTERACCVARSVLFAVLSTVRKLHEGRRMYPLRVLEASGLQGELMETALKLFSGLRLHVRDTEDCQAVIQFHRQCLPLIIHVEDDHYLKALSGVTHLIIWGINYNGMIVGLETLKRVTCLGITSVGITRASLSTWCDILCQLPLHTLNLSDNDLGPMEEYDDLTGSTLCSLYGVSTLVHLGLSRCNLTTKDVARLLGSRGCNRTLIHIDFSRNTSVDLSDVMASDLVGIQCLLTEKCRWNEKAVKKIFSSQCSLVSLGIGERTRQCRGTWCELAMECPHLTELSFTGYNFSHEEMEALTRRLSHLHLSYCDVDEVKGLGSVKHLSLFRCAVSAEAVMSLKDSQMESLFIRPSSSLPDNVGLLCEAPCLNQLWLDGLQESKWREICQGVREPLTVLGLSRGKDDDLTVKDVEGLGEIKTDVPLSQLWLAGVGDDCTAEMTKQDIRLSKQRPLNKISVCDNLYKTYQAVSGSYLPLVSTTTRQVLYH